MSTLTVTKAKNWEQVEIAANTHGVLTCIRPSGGNWGNAKKTWEQYGVGDNPDVLYYIVHNMYSAPFDKNQNVIKGYVRLFRCTTATNLYPTWVVDFVRPSLYTPVVLVTQQIHGTVLVSKFSAEDDICTHGWPIVTTAFPKIAKFPYKIRSPEESSYLVVPNHPII